MTNRLFAEAAKGRSMMVLGYEIWSLLSPNAYLDITPVMPMKQRLVAQYVSQLRTVDYAGYADGLAKVRAFHLPVAQNRTGAVEAFIAMPCPDYCDIVQRLKE